VDLKKPMDRLGPVSGCLGQPRREGFCFEGYSL
jgi:hypothetical protein